MSEFLTLQDYARLKGNPSTRAIIEVMNKTNALLDDMMWTQCNSGTIHKTTIRTSIPKPTWRLLNQGVPTGKTTTKQVSVGCGFLEIYAEVDKLMVDLNTKDGASPSDFIAQENKAFLEGFSQKLSDAVLYGNLGDNPASIVGLDSYYNAISGNAETGKYIVNAGGQGSDNQSIWLVAWGEQGVHGIYPEGTQAGIKEDFRGQVTLTDSSNNMYEGYRTHYTQACGLVVRDPGACIRIANIDTSAVTTNTSAPDILTQMVNAVYAMPERCRSMRRVFYVRPEIYKLLDIQVMSKSNIHLTYSDIQGKPILNFRGIPIREQEAIKTDEALIS